jgi:hypothetical protein
MKQKENPFEQAARPLRDLTRGLTRMQAATLQHDGRDVSTLLVHTQTAPQGDSTLWIAAEIPAWEPGLPNALLQMHLQIHHSATRIRTALVATT